MLIRAAGPADLEAINEIHGHYARTTHVSFDTRALTVEERREWFLRFEGGVKHRLLVAVDGERVVGHAHSLPWRAKHAYERTVETTILVRPGAEGRGIGSALYGTLLDEIESAGVHRAYAVIALPNDASIVFHEHHGFRSVGVLDEVGHKFGRWWSTRLMERRFVTTG